MNIDDIVLTEKNTNLGDEFDYSQIVSEADFLTQEQKNFFIEYGYVRIPKAFSRATAENVQVAVEKLCMEQCNTEVLDVAAIQLQSEFSQGFFRPNKKLTGMPAIGMNTEKVLRALDIVIGEHYYTLDELKAHGLFTMTFPGFTEKPWRAPNNAGSWHIDNGIRFEKFYSLESARCACVPVFLVTDVKPEGGATACVPGSHKVLAALFKKFGYLDYPQMRSICELMASTAKNIHTLHGDAGDLVIMHPFLAHSPSANTETTTRIMSNTALGLFRGRNYDPTSNYLSWVEESISSVIYNRHTETGKGSRLALQIIAWLRPWRKRFALYPQVQPNLSFRQKFALKMVVGLQKLFSRWVFGRDTVAYYQQNMGKSEGN
jgi:Phytanoyl-CoA dioxygenase (PhyH)